MTAAIHTDIAEGTRIAIPVAWEHCASGCVEWQLVDWVTLVDTGERIPVWFDGADEGSWGSDYALCGPQDSDWRFPDGERSSNESLFAAFERHKEQQKGFAMACARRSQRTGGGHG